ncbi:MAG: hypothetical protein ABWX83_13945 [Luteibacter sp.]
MKKKHTGTVYYTITVDTKLTAAQLAQLDALEGRPIDLSDIPEMTNDDTVTPCVGSPPGLLVVRAGAAEAARLKATADA